MEINLVGQSIRVFTKIVAKHPWLMQIYRRTKLWAFGQAKAWIQTFKASHHGYRIRLLRENLIGDYNHTITYMNVVLG
jgi:hypothetical protein